MIHFFKLIRWKNLVLIALGQILIKYALLEPLKLDYGFDTALTTPGFLLLVTSTICIAAAGYIINDIEDVEADKINKPEKVIIGKYIQEKQASILFVILNICGVIFGYFLSKAVEKPSFLLLFVLCSGLLYAYSTTLKRIVLIGNFIVAGLVAFSILIVGVFDLIPVVTQNNISTQLFFLDIIKDYAIFAFMINLIREFVKDIEDTNGDYKIGVQSLSIILGRYRATMLVFLLSLVPLILIIIYIINNLYQQLLALAYALILIVAPMLYSSIKIYDAEKKEDYSHISSVLKLIMLTGLLSLLLFQFIIKN